MSNLQQDKLKAAVLRWLPYITVFVICLVAIWPFISRPSLPSNTDAELHIYRLAELARLVRGGELYPRWAPNFYFGYGYPIFNYYAPFSYYVGLVFELMPGVDAVGAVKAVFVLGLLLGAYGMFGFVRQNWGEMPAYIAAACYVYAPYILYIDPHARGVLAESFALGLFPIVLWRLDAVRKWPNGRNIVLAALLTAALMLTHNLLTMVYGGLLLGWVVWHLIFTRLSVGKLSIANFVPLVAFCLGIGMTLFFWMPVALQRNDVNLNTLVGEQGSHFSFANHFIPFGDLYSADQDWLDWGATEPDYEFSMGVVQFSLAVAGFYYYLRQQVGRSRDERLYFHHPAFFVLATAALIFLMSPRSAFIWESVPVLPFIQFPWRLLGPLAAVGAVLAGLLFHHIFISDAPNKYKSTLFFASFWVILFLVTSKLITPAPWPESFGETTPAAVAYQETRGRWLGTTSTADFVPATVDVIPSVHPPQLDALLSNRVPDRVNYASLPAGATATFEYVRPLHFRYYVAHDEPFLLRLFLFDFPGWRVTVDSETVETQLGRPEGFLVVPIPAGPHVVDVEFIETPARRMSWLFSSLSLVLTVGFAYFVHQNPPAVAQKEPLALTERRETVRAFWIILTWTMIILIIPDSLLHYSSTGFVAEPAENKMLVDFGNQIMLIGSDVSERTVAPGDEIRLTLYWKAQQEIDIDFQSFTHVLAQDGFLVAQSDKLNPGDFPTRRWPLDKYVRDEYIITLPADLPPGTYQLSAGLWVQNEGWRLPVVDDAGNQLSDNIFIDEIEVSLDR